MKNYYSILGVTSQAESFVIKAAYRALAQHYHPDRQNGAQDEATARMSEINEAFSVLSDPEKRKQYDAQQASTFSPEPDDKTEKESIDNALDEQWRIACDYHSDLKEISYRLSKLSTSLQFTYKLTLLESKAFSNRATLAKELETAYLKKYFGENFRILKYAKNLLISNRRDAARELNKVICVLGNSVDASAIINKIEEKFPWNDPLGTKERLIDLLDHDPSNARELKTLVDQFSDLIGIPISISYEEQRAGWLYIEMPFPRFHVTRDGKVTTMLQTEFRDWVKSMS